LIRLLLPLAAFAAFFALSLATVRLLRPAQPRRFFLAFGAILVAASVLIYRRLWPLDRLEDAIGLAACVAVQLLLCLTFWNSFYSLLWGFSGGLMHDLLSDPSLRYVDRLVRSYEGTGPTDRIMARRLPNLVAGRYLDENGGRFTLTRKGRLVGAATLAVLRAFSLGMGGGIR